MSIKVDMTSADIDRQLELLKYYPEVMNKHFRSRMYKAVGGLRKAILPTIPHKTGKAQATFGSRVTGKGINMTGQVGWYDRGDPWYPNVLEYGAKPHKIVAREGGFLWFGGTIVRSVDHPGFSARGFMAAGFSAQQASINESMQEASDAVLAEMAVR